MVTYPVTVNVQCYAIGREVVLLMLLDQKFCCILTMTNYLRVYYWVPKCMWSDSDNCTRLCVKCLLSQTRFNVITTAIKCVSNWSWSLLSQCYGLFSDKIIKWFSFGLEYGHSKLPDTFWLVTYLIYFCLSVKKKN